MISVKNPKQIVVARLPIPEFNILKMRFKLILTCTDEEFEEGRVKVIVFRNSYSH